MNCDPEHANELYLERGGPIQRFVERLSLKWRMGHSIYMRILTFLALTWFPLVVFALLEGRALEDSPRESLLLDFGTYARFFIAVPLLLLAESVIGPRLRAAGMQFMRGGFVRSQDEQAYNEAIASATRWCESAWAEVVLISIAMLGAWGFTAETVYGEGLSTWRSLTRTTEAGEAVSLTGFWYRCVALPILQYFWYRWMWRLFVWTRFLWTISKLDLNLVATHADQAGGLGFLGTAHTSLGIFAFSLSSVLSAEAAFLMVYHHADIKTFQVPYITILLLVEIVSLAPLLVFMPTLIRARLAALRDYGLLVTRYNRAFHAKWIMAGAPVDEPLLGNADMQSLADLGSSFEFIRAMKIVPFSERVILQLVFATSIPCMPLILLVVPVNQILELVTKAVF